MTKMCINTVFQILTGRRIKKLIRKDSQTIEKWNDAYTPENRDRLGLKEARFQSLLAQVLREHSYDVIVESYPSSDKGHLKNRSCDLYASKGKTSCWIEIKREDVVSKNNYGGRNILEQALCDIGKMKAGKSRGDLVVIWIGFFGHWDDFKRCFPAQFRASYTFKIQSIKPGWLRSMWSGNGKLKPRSRIMRWLGNAGQGSVPQALLDLKHWINANGGRCEIIKVFRPKTAQSSRGWVSYGILCGMMR